jgi:preprotein translocase subunit SecF
MRADLNIDFIGKRKIFYTISVTLMVIGLLVSIIFGVKLDIQFKGGAIIKYSYTGTIDRQKAEDIAEKTLNDNELSTSLDEDYGTHTKTLVFEIDNNLTDEMQTNLYNAISSEFKDNQITKYQSNDVSASIGREFIRKSILAVVLACLCIILYIWIRFRKIGGLPAGLTAFAALLHDVIIGFVAFAIFRIPLNDNFIAVILTILGYSINDTIVIYDRIRENRRLYGSKVPFKDTVNKSINQSFARSINTSLCTFAAIAVLAVFSIIYHLDSVTSFALPMMIGVATGCYSTICIAGPLWVTWETHKEKKLAAEKLRIAQEKEQRKQKQEEIKTAKAENKAVEKPKKPSKGKKGKKSKK